MLYLNLTEATWSLHMVLYYLRRVLKYGPLVVLGIQGESKGSPIRAQIKGPCSYPDNMSKP